MHAEDPYPSRDGGAVRRIKRHEPVLHGGSEASGPLSQQQLQVYESQGFLVVPGVFTPVEVAAFKTAARAMCTAAEPEHPRLVREPGSNDIRSIFAVHKNDSPLAHLTGDARLVDCARQILGGPVGIHQSRVNFKPGLVGREFGWHSDFETWHAEDGMPRMQALSMSVLLSDNHTCNGPTLMIPGSHKTFVSCPGLTPDQHYLQSLRRQEYGVPDHDSIRDLVHQAISPAYPLGIAEAIGSPGSVLIFDCNVLHGSAGNLTPYERTNVFIVYSALTNALGRPFGAFEPRPDYIAASPLLPPPSAAVTVAVKASPLPSSQIEPPNFCMPPN